MHPIRALLLDLGGVLVHHQPARLVERMAEVARVPLAAFTDAYWSHRGQIDLTGDVRRYWLDVLRDARSPLHERARGEACAALGALDAESWTQFREPVWEIARRFRAAGGRVGLLSNCGPEVMDRIEELRPHARTFDATIVSWEVGLLKPDPAIYRLAIERLQVEPGATLFVDDRAENVAAAEAVGLQGLCFTGDESLAALRQRTRVG